MKVILLKILVILTILSFVYKTSLPPKIHVYYDPATSAALLQMTNFIKVEKRDFKFIFWSRYDRFIQNKESYPNTFFSTNWDTLFKRIQEVSDAHPDSKIILHHNIHHNYFFDHFISVFGKSKIAEIHTYEDASNYVWWTTRNQYIIYDNPDIKHKVHIWGDIDKLCSGDDKLKHCPEIKKLQKHATIIPVDYYEIRKKLSKSDHKKLAQIIGVDFDRYEKLLKGKKTGVYLLGFIAGSNQEIFQLPILKKVCDFYQDTVWFYKPHPTTMGTPNSKVLNYLCPNIQRLDPYVPFEFLILTKLNPKYVAGMGSSTFFNLKPENILAYVQRGYYDFYIPTLKKAGLISKPRKLITPEQSTKNLIDMNIINISQHGWYIKIANEYCSVYGNNCYNIISDEKTLKTLKKSNGDIFKTSLSDSYNWTALEPVSE